MKKFILQILSCCLAVLLLSPAFPQDYLDQWRTFASGKDSVKLLKWLHVRAERILSGKPGKSDPDSLCPVEPPSFYGSLGVFITLLKEGRPRGCYGSFNHGCSDISTVLLDCLGGALRRDFRVDPLSIEELDEVEIVLTVASQPFPVSSPGFVDIQEYGIMIITRDGRKLVFVPAEIKTHEYLEKLCGAPPYRSVYAFRSVTIRD